MRKFGGQVIETILKRSILIEAQRGSRWLSLELREPSALFHGNREHLSVVEMKVEHVFARR